VPQGFERLAINALGFMSSVLGCDEYKVSLIAHHTTSSTSRAVSATGDQETSRQAISEAATVIDEFFSAERCPPLLDLVLHRLLPLRAADLDEWVGDPEAYHLTTSSLAPEESPRASAELLLVCLLEERAAYLAPLINQLLADTPAQAAAAAAEAGALSSGSALPTEVLLWDARYLAAGIAGTQLRAAGLDFSSWFLGTLGPALTALIGSGGGGDTPPVLRRRILWIVGAWMAEVRDDLRPALYAALVQMLSSSGAAAAAEKAVGGGGGGGDEVDAAVSLTLLRTLHSAVDSWDFNVTAFRPLVSDAGNWSSCAAFLLFVFFGGGL